MRKIRRALLSVPLLAATSLAVQAQAPGDPAPRIAAQREAIAVLDRMNGTWRGPAWIISPTGERHTTTQTERVGSFLDGTVKVIEGRGYGADGAVVFNAFAIISYDPDRRSYGMRSYARGHAGDFTITPTADGLTWEIPAGPAVIRYTAVIRDGTWHEFGERIVPGQEPIRFIEFTLTRVGDTEWPVAGAVPHR
ncbi:MAG TPA: hypothetical protein VFZ56_01600 [Gemmatimonadaceae bacterium]